MALGVDLGPEGGEVEDVEALDVEEPEGEVTLSDDEAEALAAAKPAVDKIAAEVGEPEEVEDVDVDMDLDVGDEDLDLDVEEEVPGNRPMATYQEGRKKRRIKEDSRGRETAHYSEDKDADERRYDDMLDKVKELEEHIHALKGDMDYDAEHIEEGSSQDDVVKEVARRVATRLAKENQQEEMVDHLAERIMARLVK
jgi:hypothetical protein